MADTKTNLPNKADVVRDAVASVIDDLDERPDDRTIMLMRHAARRAANAYEHHILIHL